MPLVPPITHPMLFIVSSLTYLSLDRQREQKNLRDFLNPLLRAREAGFVRIQPAEEQAALEERDEQSREGCRGNASRRGDRPLLRPPDNPVLERGEELVDRCVHPGIEQLGFRGEHSAKARELLPLRAHEQV